MVRYGFLRSSFYHTVFDTVHATFTSEWICRTDLRLAFCGRAGKILEKKSYILAIFFRSLQSRKFVSSIYIKPDTNCRSGNFLGQLLHCGKSVAIKEVALKFEIGPIFYDYIDIMRSCRFLLPSLLYNVCYTL